MPLRAVSESLGYRLNWNAITKTAMLYSDNCDIQPEIPETEYTETDLYWLSRIICAESCVEPYEGKIAVGNVVLNRVKNPDYPDTIYDVIFDRKYAVQFEPTANGTIYQTPDETCIRAAKECLSGRQVINDCLYFLNPELAKSKWIIENCKYVTTIGGHDFYV